jgi:hypothetical protein
MNDDDFWLEQPTEVPARLRPILKQYGHVANVNLAYAVAGELGLPTDRLGLAACKVMLRVMRRLADIADGRDRMPDANEIAYQVVDGLTVSDVRDVLVGLGGKRVQMTSRADYWDVDARKALSDYLTPFVRNLLDRWESQGRGSTAPNRRSSAARR